MLQNQRYITRRCVDVVPESPNASKQPENSYTYAYMDDSDGSSGTLGSGLGVYSETTVYGGTGINKVLYLHEDGMLRPFGWELKDGTTVEATASYGYDTAGRLNRVDPGFPLPASPAFSYGYVTDSPGLVDTVTGPAHTVSNNWEGDRDVLLDKKNHLGTPANPVSKYDYSVSGATGDGANSIGQRKNVATTGSGFDPSLSATTATGPAYAWAYNSRGELEEASDTSAANQDRAYQYDAIGNREKAVDGLLGDLPSTSNYSANSLNQYTKANSVTLPIPAYDADGNYTHGPFPVATGNATLAWDAENRMVKVTRADSTVIDYTYDYLGRLISQKAGSATAEFYLYNGWNLIAKYTGPPLEETYTWGMDLSGTLQGAGGVGGLLAVTDQAATGDPTYYLAYDGNGNVSEYLDVSGAIQAHYEYDPFGNTTVATGPKAADFVHRFSTKPLDAETGLYYYGYRYYDPQTGRWPSRDPIEERGGVNLYGFLFNDANDFIDFLGNNSLLAQMNAAIAAGNTAAIGDLIALAEAAGGCEEIVATGEAALEAIAAAEALTVRKALLEAAKQAKRLSNERLKELVKDPHKFKNLLKKLEDVRKQLGKNTNFDILLDKAGRVVLEGNKDKILIPLGKTLLELMN